MGTAHKSVISAFHEFAGEQDRMILDDGAGPETRLNLLAPIINHQWPGLKIIRPRQSWREAGVSEWDIPF
ncbi:hypothetical protein PM082_014044 [Marasmius tenuissimus]|nr:hypothetical protein PM082_014044 [Marasmius tenuissimus]